MKILLFFPNFKLYETFNTLSHQPPLGLGYLASMLEREKISYDVLDATAENLTLKQISERIKNINPDYIGMTTNISMVYATCVQARFIQKYFPNIKIIMGGPWATAEYEFILKKKYCDCVVMGEGENSLKELLKSTNWNFDNLKKINGIVFIENNIPIKTEPQPHMKNLDLLGFPIWDKFPITKYDSIHRMKPYFPIMTSRGCPFDCINCTKIIHGYQVRYRSIESIIAELKYLKNDFNCNEVLVMDDVFNFDLKRAKLILRAIIKENFGFKIQLMNGIRADIIDEEFVALLPKAGVYRTGIGVESGSSQVIKFLQKKLNLKKLPEAINLLHKYNQIVVGFFMFGLPIETPNSMIYSIDFADRLNIDTVYFFKINLFPGTKLFQYITNNKKVISNRYNPHTLNYHTNSLEFESDNFNQHDIAKIWKYYLIRFYLNPRRIIHFLKTNSLPELIYFTKRFVNLVLSMIFTKKKISGSGI